MRDRRLEVNVVLIMLAFVGGACFIQTRTSDGIANEHFTEVAKSFAFGNATIAVGDIEHPEARRAMVISRNGIPFLMLYENHTGEIDKFAVVNQEHGVIALAELQANGISVFGVHGNPVDGHSSTPVLLMTASDSPGIWDGVTYAATKPRGNQDYYPMSGEVYDDIDFDGQFDAKRIYNESSEIISMSIYVEGTWKEICRVNESGLFLKVGKYYPKQREAFSTEVEARTHYRFYPGAGWKVDRVEDSEVGWQIDETNAIDGQTRIDDVTKLRTEQQGVLTRFPPFGNR